MARILVIDDVAGVRRSIGGVLARDGHEVSEATDGVEGVEIARRTAPDLVITDLLMPRLDGLDTIDRLREAGLTCPILAISGGGALVEAGDALAAATHLADATLAKPFETDDLRRSVAGLLGGRP